MRNRIVKRIHFYLDSTKGEAPYIHVLLRNEGLNPFDKRVATMPLHTTARGQRMIAAMLPFLAEEEDDMMDHSLLHGLETLLSQAFVMGVNAGRKNPKKNFGKVGEGLYVPGS